MSRPRTTFKQVDISRAVRGATAAGLAVVRVEIDADGKIVIISQDTTKEMPSAADARSGIIGRRLRGRRNNG
jgi:hypothetical protein